MLYASTHRVGSARCCRTRSTTMPLDAPWCRTCYVGLFDGFVVVRGNVKELLVMRLLGCMTKGGREAGLSRLPLWVILRSDVCATHF
jgi:hypothetical protein